MKFALYTNIVSPHQLPLARELVKRVGAENYRYIYSEPLHKERVNMGWKEENDAWCVCADSDVAKHWLVHADVLICCIRDVELIESRCRFGLKTFYTCERWFKPPLGILRMLVPSYRAMANKIVSLANHEPNFILLPIGVHAVSDFVRIGVLREKMVLWGYFVAPSNSDVSTFRARDAKSLRLLWVGRMIKWKRVETIILAASELHKRGINCSVTLVGNGAERNRLETLTREKRINVKFEDSVGIDEVRRIMHEHDVYVLSSDGGEGWGAAVNEAIEEGMTVVGTFEAGSSATMLSESMLFHAGKYKDLAALLKKITDGQIENIDRKRWSVESAAEKLLKLVSM